MRSSLLLGILASAAVSGSAQAGVFIDEFNGITLNPIWTLRDEANSYTSGGGFSFNGDFLRFDNIKNSAYGYISTTVDTTGGIRADAVVRNDNYYSVNYAPGVALYFDENNWISIKVGGAGGEVDGWNAIGVIGGNYYKQPMQASDAAYRFDFHIGGVELTDTSINFYASPIPPVPPGSNMNLDPNNIDSVLSLVHTISRPGTFTGEAQVIVGQGFTHTGSGAPNAELANIQTHLMSAFVGIDLVRLSGESVVPEPSSAALILLGGAALLRRCRDRHT